MRLTVFVLNIAIGFELKIKRKKSKLKRIITLYFPQVNFTKPKVSQDNEHDDDDDDASKW